MKFFKKGLTLALATIMLGTTATTVTMAQAPYVYVEDQGEKEIDDLKMFEGFEAVVKLLDLSNKEIATLTTKVKDGKLGLDFLKEYEFKSVKINKLEEKKIAVSIVIDTNYEKMINDLKKLVDKYNAEKQVINSYVDYIDNSVIKEEKKENETSEKTEADKQQELAKAKEEALKKLKEAGITSNLYINSINRAKTIEGVKALTEALLKSHEDSKTPLQKAKEKALKELKEAGITSPLFLDKINSAKTEEGVEALKNELIKSHKETKQNDFMNDLRDEKTNKEISKKLEENDLDKLIVIKEDKKEEETPEVPATPDDKKEEPKEDTTKENTAKERVEKFNKGETLNFEEFRNEFMTLLNNERKEKGLEPIELSEHLQKGVETRSNELAEFGSIGTGENKDQPHKRPNGKDSFRTAFDYLEDYEEKEGKSLGENTLSFSYNPKYGKVDNEKVDKVLPDAKKMAQVMFKQWKESKSHYDNMMREDYKTTWIDAKMGNADYTVAEDNQKEIIVGVQVFDLKTAEEHKTEVVGVPEKPNTPEEKKEKDDKVTDEKKVKCKTEEKTIEPKDETAEEN